MNKQNLLLMIRISVEGKKAITKRAKELKMSTSEYMRECSYNEIENKILEIKKY